MLGAQIIARRAGAAGGQCIIMSAFKLLQVNLILRLPVGGGPAVAALPKFHCDLIVGVVYYEPFND